MVNRRQRKSRQKPSTAHPAGRSSKVSLRDQARDERTLSRKWANLRQVSSKSRRHPLETHRYERFRRHPPSTSLSPMKKICRQSHAASVAERVRRAVTANDLARGAKMPVLGSKAVSVKMKEMAGKEGTDVIWVCPSRPTPWGWMK